MDDKPELTIKGMPVHVCDKAPDSQIKLIHPLFKNCPYCGKKLRD